MVRIGVCEDNESVREVLKLLLANYGKRTGQAIDVMIYPTGDEVLSANLDILILNVAKPEMDGIELGQEMRKKNEKLQLFYVTACKENELRGYDLGEYAYLRKPFDINAFYRKIDNLVRNVGV